MAGRFGGHSCEIEEEVLITWPNGILEVQQLTMYQCFIPQSELELVSMVVTALTTDPEIDDFASAELE